MSHPERKVRSVVPNDPIDPASVQASFDELSGILADVMVTVSDVSTRRCPYRDRLDRCTAAFGCRNQRPNPDPAVAATGGRVCNGDDKLDYRGAWETS